MEIWKEWPMNPKYQISSEGRVKGLNGRILKTDLHNGYIQFSLRPEPNKTKKCLAHRLVAETFLENFNDDLIVDHINGIKTDNRVENLRMTTRKMNLNFASTEWNSIQKDCKQIVEKYGYKFLQDKLKEILDV